nr:putative trna(ile)-lysidine synthase [Quercus suber]
MALATLCSSIQNAAEPRPDFTGFIVDHGLRANSSDEAEKVAAELARLKINPRILKLDRSAFAKGSGGADHVEKTARQLRYRAIGKACYEHGIESLLVAHHADDQAETVLQRMTQNYLGNGLRGIKVEAGVPHCDGIYGVYESGGFLRRLRNGDVGSPDKSQTYIIRLETGGVKILRPLLPATKSQLITLCEDSGTKWFEDHTNADVSLATRNAVRHLQKENLLPMALRRTRLFGLADGISRKVKEIERLAKIELGQTDVLLDLRTGKAAFTISKGTFAAFELPPDVEYNAKAVLLRMLIRLVSPDARIELSQMHSGVDMVFPSAEKGDPDLLFQDEPAQASIAGVQIRRVTGTTGFLAYTLRRAPVSPVHMTSLRTVQSPASEADNLEAPKWSTEFKLWDNRYWVRLGSMQRDVVIGRKFVVRHYSQNDRAMIMDGLPPRERREFLRHLAEAAGRARFSIPVIVEEHNNEQETIVALPTLAWHTKDCGSWPTGAVPANDQRLLYDIRYKHVDFPLNRDRHRIIGHTPKSRWNGQKTRPHWAERVRHMIARRQTLETRRISGQASLREFIGLDKSRRMSLGRKYVIENRKKAARERGRIWAGQRLADVDSPWRNHTSGDVGASWRGSFTSED